MSQYFTKSSPSYVKELTDSVIKEVKKIIVGKEYVVKYILTSLFVGGHVLLEGVPGVAKTLIAKTVAKAFNMKYSRIQATPDLLPSDIIGTFVFDPKTGDFKPRKGPIFANIVLFDEINRASPRTQSALLEAMQEGQVTIEGETYRLPQPFIVIATMNPIEMEGTFPLPEAQLDRFLMKINVDLPSHDEHIKIMKNIHTIQEFNVAPVASGDDILKVRAMLPAVEVKDEVMHYIVRIIEETHNDPSVKLGGSPRAAISLYLCSKAHALMEGRDYVIPDDIKAIAAHVLRHRILLSPEAELEGVTPDSVIRSILNKVPVPTPGVKE